MTQNKNKNKNELVLLSFDGYSFQCDSANYFVLELSILFHNHGILRWQWQMIGRLFLFPLYYM